MTKLSVLFGFMGMLFYSFSAAALVDYSEAAPVAKQRSTKRKVVRRPAPNSSTQSTSTSKKGAKSALLGMFKIDSIYSTEEVELEDKVEKIKKAAFQVLVDLKSYAYLDLKYQMLASESEELASTGQYQDGNVEANMGLNWLRFGDKMSYSDVDLIIGHRWGQKGSDFASTRNDFLLGVQTTKRIDKLALGLSYHLDLTGKPKHERETEIGNIQTLRASLGWIVSNDIKIAFHARKISIGTGSGIHTNNTLNKKLEFTTLNPELALAVGPGFDLKMGGNFRSERVRLESEFESVKLNHLSGIWGNNIYAGLDFSL